MLASQSHSCPLVPRTYNRSSSSVLQKVNANISGFIIVGEIYVHVLSADEDGEAVYEPPPPPLPRSSEKRSSEKRTVSLSPAPERESSSLLSSFPPSLPPYLLPLHPLHSGKYFIKKKPPCHCSFSFSCSSLLHIILGENLRNS